MRFVPHLVPSPAFMFHRRHFLSGKAQAAALNSFAPARLCYSRPFLSSSRTANKMSQDDRTDIATPTRPGQKSVGRIGGACFVCRAKKRKVRLTPAPIHSGHPSLFLPRAWLCLLGPKGQMISLFLAAKSSSISLTREHSAVVKSES